MSTENINFKQRSKETVNVKKKNQMQCARTLKHKHTQTHMHTHTCTPCQSEISLHKLVGSRVFIFTSAPTVVLHIFFYIEMALAIKFMRKSHTTSPLYADFYQFIVYLIKLVASEIKSRFITRFYYWKQSILITYYRR